MLLWTPQHDAAGCEPLDQLYDALAEVVGAEDASECYKSYLLVGGGHGGLWGKLLAPDSDGPGVLLVLQPSGEAVSLLENVALISDGTTGLVTWEAALFMAEWALDQQQTFSGRWEPLSEPSTGVVVKMTSRLKSFKIETDFDKMNKMTRISFFNF